jgi:hypothetical protein
MKQESVVHAGKDTLFHLLGQSLKCLSISLVQSLANGFDLLRALGVSQRSHKKHIAVAHDLQRRFSVDPKQLKHRAINDQRKAVSVPGESLDHDSRDSFRISIVSPNAQVVKPSRQGERT